MAGGEAMKNLPTTAAEIAAMDKTELANVCLDAIAENARLRDALDEIAFAPPGACGPDLKGCIRIAREALEVKP
jgi:hypothetical protein